MIMCLIFALLSSGIKKNLSCPEWLLSSTVSFSGDFWKNNRCENILGLLETDVVST